MKIFICLLILATFLIPSLDADHFQTSRKVAVTIDDLPVNSKIFPDAKNQKQITSRLLKALCENQVPAIGFVNEKKLYKNKKVDPLKIEILNLWLQAGLDLGNHTFSHPDLHRIPVDDFIKDISLGETILRPLMQKAGKPLKYFRHPFLHTGRTMAIKNKVETYLKNLNYQVAPVSIDNSEWVFAFAYEKAIIKNDKPLKKKISAAYIKYMDAMFEYYEEK